MSLTGLDYTGIGSGLEQPTADTARLSWSQLVAVAQQAGLSPSQANVAAAIAEAESGGRPRAYNGVGGDNSYGLWQINMIGGLGPARRAQFGIASNDQLYDPVTNAKAMFIVSGGGNNWQPWTTYTSGAYKAFLGGAGAPAGDPSSNGGGGSSSSGGSSTPVAVNNKNNTCLIGGGDIHNPVPGLGNASIPCLLYKSQGLAILGALALVAGGGLMLVGALVVAGRSKTVQGAAGLVTSGGRSALTSSTSSSSTLRRGGSVRPLQTESDIDDNRQLLRMQDEAAADSRQRRLDRAALRRAHESTREEPF